MRFHFRLCLAALAVASGASTALADCKSVGAIGTGINEGMAKFMADAGLKNVLEGKGLKGTGAIKYTCSAGAVVTECSARQQGCK